MIFHWSPIHYASTPAVARHQNAVYVRINNVHHVFNKVPSKDVARSDEWWFEMAEVFRTLEE
jgi:hypothetical protein